MTPTPPPLILVTGATGKVGRTFIARLLGEERFQHWRVRALCHLRSLPAHERIESVFGAIQDRAAVLHALHGVTHVLHLATSKETPDDVMAIPVLLDQAGVGLLRNFVHVDDLVGAILAAIDEPRARHQLMNVCMDEPVDYVRLGDHLARTRGCPLVPIRDRYHSTWLDNSKARFLLRWRPQYDLVRLVDAAWAYERAADDPRRVWYPG